MRVFVQIRNFALNYKELSEKLKQLESKYDKSFNDIYRAIHYLIEKENQNSQQKARTKIGFKKDSK